MHWPMKLPQTTNMAVDIARMRTLAILSVLLALAGCKKSEPDPASSTEKIVDDNQTLAAANAAAGEVVRAAGDCDAVKAALPETKRKLEEAGKRVRTLTGRASLDSLNKQVANIAGACP